MATSSSKRPVNEAAGDELVFLFSWGANSYGQLVSGHKEDTMLPTPCSLPSSMAQRLHQITGGGGHTVLLAEDGDIYVCGWNKNGQLGLSSQQVDYPTFCKVPSLPRKITKVSCGWSHTVALTEDGIVYVWGSNAFGQLGVPEVQKQSESPVQLSTERFFQFKVCDIAAGLRHSLVLTENGKVFSWGDGKKGQLGHGAKEITGQAFPGQIASLDGIKCTYIAVGAYHSAVLSEHEEVFAWGLNQHGQCGVGPVVASTYSSSESFKLSPSNDWIVNVYLPIKVEGLPSVAEVRCGWSHTLAITTGERKIFSWGRGDYGQLGRDIRGEGANQTAVCCPTPMEVPTLKNVRQVACGSEHTVVLNDREEVVTFGWNEHGICGTGNETNVHSPCIISKSFEGWRIMLIGAGAGHSLVVANKPTKQDN